MKSTLTDKKFQRCIPLGYHLYEMRLPQNIVLLYVGDRPITLEEFKQTASTLPAYVEAVFDKDESNISVGFIRSSIPGKGFATLLLLVLFIKANKEGITTITLDDDSDNYRKPNNIYTKLGLKYIEEDGPEMIGDIQHVIKMWKSFSQKMCSTNM